MEAKTEPKTWAIVTILVALIGCAGVLGAAFINTLPDLMHPTPIIIIATSTELVYVPTTQPITSQIENTPENTLPEVSSPTAINAPLSVNTESTTEKGILQALNWVKSPVWTGSQAGIQDETGKYWMEPNFDDSSWSNLTFSDQGGTPEYSDLYYRAHFTWDGVSKVILSFTSDDGIDVYINGIHIGTWGNGWRQVGCINISTCAVSEKISPQVIPTSILKTGDNIIAVNLTNGPYTPSNYFVTLDIGYIK